MRNLFFRKDIYIDVIKYVILNGSIKSVKFLLETSYKKFRYNMTKIMEDIIQKRINIFKFILKKSCELYPMFPIQSYYELYYDGFDILHKLLFVNAKEFKICMDIVKSSTVKEVLLRYLRRGSIAKLQEINYPHKINFDNSLPPNVLDDLILSNCAYNNFNKCGIYDSIKYLDYVLK